MGKDCQRKTDGWIKGFTCKQSWKLLLVGYGMHFQRSLLYWNTESASKATHCLSNLLAVLQQKNQNPLCIAHCYVYMQN